MHLFLRLALIALALGCWLQCASAVSSLVDPADCPDSCRWIVVPALGPEGPIGRTGDRGNTGPQGLAGPQGVSGQSGIQGLTGPQGIKGDRGEQGLPGAQGMQGLTGPIGPKGDQGVHGLKGDRGETGSQGPQGETGLTGPHGPQGDTGPQGDQGATGLIGPQGNKGDTGAQGLKGDTGLQGLQGTPGIFFNPAITYVGMKVEDSTIANTVLTGIPSIDAVRVSTQEVVTRALVGKSGHPRGGRGEALTKINPTDHDAASFLWFRQGSNSIAGQINLILYLDKAPYETLFKVGFDVPISLYYAFVILTPANDAARRLQSQGGVYVRDNPDTDYFMVEAPVGVIFEKNVQYSWTYHVIAGER